MAEAKNTFLKGKMNQDLDSRLIPTSEYREAINLQIGRSEGSSVGEFENMLGNTNVRALNTDVGSEIIGRYIDESNNNAYIFATDWSSNGETMSVAKNHYIYQVSLSAPYTATTLVTGNFLNLNKSFPIIGVNLVEDLLFWTDNLNQPRKINILRAASNATHYQNEDQISVAKYAPFEPIIVLNRTKVIVNGAVTDSSSITVDDSTGVQIGDIVSPFATITPPPVLWNDLIYVIAITGNIITLSKAVTAADDFVLVFQNSTMTNKTNEYLPNGEEVSITVVTGTGLATVYTYEGSAIEGYANNTPKIGAIVTGVGVPENTTVLSSTAQWGSLDGTTWDITLSKIPSPVIAVGSKLKININPNYDNAWSSVGDPDFLEDKFIRFSYRFKYEDNEYSIMAPFSQPMFVPKQNSTFGGGVNSDVEDMDDAYKSTIITWFENNIENILLKIPMPYASPLLNSTELKVTDIDILYKESDALAVKVLDTVTLSGLPANNFNSISWNDPIHGENTLTYYYQYDYTSSKPYKTLPSNQTTRVYDKVPVKALAQEIIGNRIVYGNYIDKLASPASIAFSAIVDKKKPAFDNVVQYPYHNLKQNRTYQVGFVLSDRYGRQSDVILSSYDNLEGTSGSTVYSSYNTYNEQIAEPIIDWLGDSLNVRIDTAISGGNTGLYSATNPLGWYSYKVVVKQQQQEYYNVYLPGFVNGLPITSDTDEDKTSFSTLLSDNINKVPRDLKEVGPTDTEYSSGETLYVRVNNPNINNKTSNRGYGIPLKNTAWNKQYYPGFKSQEVLSIQTVRDMEISAIPFVSNAPEGDYGQVGTLTTGSVTAPVSVGSIPWGVSAIVQPFYNSDLNPFAIKIDSTSNGTLGIASTVPLSAGGIGAVTTTLSDPATQGIQSMTPFLSVVETKPVYSLLDIFWETSLQGKISVLNSLINSQDSGLVSTNVSAGNFSEADAVATQIGSVITWNTGGGTTVTDNSHLSGTPPIIFSAFRASDLSTDVSGLFSLVYSGNAAEYQLKTNQLFSYTEISDDVPSNDVYYITFQTVYDTGVDPEGPQTNETPYTATLTNTQPSFVTCPGTLSGITIASTTIYSFAAVNGSNSANTAIIKEAELLFSLSPSNSSAITNQFTMSSSGTLTTNSALTEGITYTVIARVTDVNGDGISRDCTVDFTIGVQHTPKAICEGYKGSISATCGESFEAFFGVNASTASTGIYPTISDANGNNAISFQGNHIQFYNVKSESTVSGVTTGSLTQGVVSITPILTTTGTTVTAYYAVQYRSSSSQSWSLAVEDGEVIPTNRYQLTASNGFPGTETRNFSTAGEYRVITTNVGGEACISGGTHSLTVDFGDYTYPNSCTGPV